MTDRPPCTNPTCGQPAADGLMLCWTHTRHLDPDIQETALLHDELGLRFLTGTNHAERVSGSPGAVGLNLDPAAVDARTHIRHTLVAWAKLVTDECPDAAQPFDDQPATLANYLRYHRTWLVKHELAGEASTEFHLLAHGQCRRIAYPDSSHTVTIGACPHDREDGGRCTGTLKARVRREDTLLPAQVICDTDRTHVWASYQWPRLARQMAAAASTVPA